MVQINFKGQNGHHDPFLRGVCKDRNHISKEEDKRKKCQGFEVRKEEESTSWRIYDGNITTNAYVCRNNVLSSPT